METFGKLVSDVLFEHRWHISHNSQSNKGIISKEHLQCIWKIHDTPFLIDLLNSLDFILPLDNNKQTYLVPCMLPRENSDLQRTDLTYRAVHKPNVDDIPSVGAFHRLLVLCAQTSNWKLNTSDHLLHNNASFQVTEGTYLVLSQISDTIQVSTWTSKEKLDKGKVSNDEIRTILFDIRKKIARKMVALGIQQSKTFRMLCPHWRPGDEYLCLVEIEEVMEPQPDNFIFQPKYNKCAVHNKMLDPRLFFVTDEF